MGNRNYRLASLERSTAAFGRLGLIIGFALVGVLTATTAVWSNIAPNLAAMCLLFVIIRRVKSTTSGGPTGRDLAKKIGAYAFKGWGGVSANLVNWRLDQAILPALTHATQLGYYAVAVSLAEIPSMMIGATKNVVFSEASHRNDPRIAARGTRIVILISVIIDVGVAILARPIVTILFGRSFGPAVEMARILLVANVPWIAEVVLAAGLLSSGRPGLRSTGQIVAAVITVAGLIILVPLIGALGAAWVSLTAYSINFVLTLLMFHHVTKIRYRDAVDTAVGGRPVDVALLVGPRAEGVHLRHEQGEGEPVVTSVATNQDLPTDDERPERRRRKALIAASIVVTVVIAGALVALGKPGSKLHPVAATTTTTAPTGGYAAQVSAADATLTGLLGLSDGWDATAGTLQSDMGTVRSDATSALTALQAARTAHRAKPQDCAGVVAAGSRVQSLTTSIESTASDVSGQATLVLGALGQSQAQVDQLASQIAAAGAQASSAQKAALETLQVSASALDSRRTAMTQTMTDLQQKADAATRSAQAVAAQSASLVSGCNHAA